MLGIKIFEGEIIQDLEKEINNFAVEHEPYWTNLFIRTDKGIKKVIVEDKIISTEYNKTIYTITFVYNISERKAGGFFGNKIDKSGRSV